MRLPPRYGNSYSRHITSLSLLGTYQYTRFLQDECRNRLNLLYRADSVDATGAITGKENRTVRRFHTVHRSR